MDLAKRLTALACVLVLPGCCVFGVERACTAPLEQACAQTTHARCQQFLDDPSSMPLRSDTVAAIIQVFTWLGVIAAWVMLSHRKRGAAARGPHPALAVRSDAWRGLR